jgi:hypothetical protein
MATAHRNHPATPPLPAGAEHHAVASHAARAA